MLASCRQLARAGLASPLDQLRYLWTEAQILARSLGCCAGPTTATS
jgi:hypothetical protein